MDPRPRRPGQHLVAHGGAGRLRPLRIGASSHGGTCVLMFWHFALSFGRYRSPPRQKSGLEPRYVSSLSHRHDDARLRSARDSTRAARRGRVASPGKRHGVPVDRAARSAQLDCCRLGGEGRKRQRAAGDHRDQPLLRAHDVQGHADHWHPRRRPRPQTHRAAEGGQGPAQRAGLLRAVPALAAGHDRRSLGSRPRHRGDEIAAGEVGTAHG